MSEPALPPLSFASREFSSADLELIRQITSDFAGLGITEIARTACELLEWKRPSGGLKNLECRRLIEHLAGQGLLRLPERRGRGAPGPRRVARTARGESPAEIRGSAGEFAPLRLEVVRGEQADHSGNHALFKELLDRHHYLGYRVPFGASLRYLVRSQRASGQVLACLLWSSPAWKMAARASCRRTGRGCTATGRCCWKRWWMRNDCAAPVTGRRTGLRWDKPPGAGAWTADMPPMARR
jgi:hypothetical protein